MFTLFIVTFVLNKYYNMKFTIVTFLNNVSKEISLKMLNLLLIKKITKNVK